MPAAQPRQRADADVLGDRPEREDAVRLAVARDQRHRRVTSMPGLRRPAASKTASSRSVWPCPDEPGEADDLALVGDQLRTVELPSRSRADAPRARFVRVGERSARPLARLSRAAHHRDQRVAVECADGSAAATLPSRITTTRSACLEHLAEQVRDQDAALAGGHEAPHEGEQLARRVRVERRRRLVEDDQVAAAPG